MNYQVDIPEPPPINRGEQVTEKLIIYLESIKEKAPLYTISFNNIILPSKNSIDEIIQIIRLRDQYGFKKYGQHLMTGDQRDTINDALQEFGDLIQYIFKAKLNNEDLSALKNYLPILNVLINS